MSSSILSYLSIIIPVLVNVAFLTLLERKVLGYVQERKGPNKVSFFGLLQPFADAVKLFLKESILPQMGNLGLYFLAPCLSLILVLWLWQILPCKMSPFIFSYSAVLLLMIMSMGVYPVLLAGWASNSKYALIGSLRGVAQTISYEVSLALFMFSVIVVVGQLDLEVVSSANKEFLILGLLMPVAALWFVSCLAETNRTPFDFAEGESELVSGFNIEYGSGGFALIFMAEYASILFLSLLTSALFFSSSMSLGKLYLSMLILSFVWIWARGTLPRYRYDMLMNLAWKSLLPSSLNYVLGVLSISLLFS